MDFVEMTFSRGMVETSIDPPMQKWKMLAKTLNNCFDEVSRKLDYQEAKK